MFQNRWGIVSEKVPVSWGNDSEKSQGRTKEAEAFLQKALTINPSYVNGWLHLAEAKVRDGDLKGARYAAERALRVDPESVPAQLLLRRITAQREQVPMPFA